MVFCRTNKSPLYAVLLAAILLIFHLTSIQSTKAAPAVCFKFEVTIGPTGSFAVTLLDLNTLSTFLLEVAIDFEPGAVVTRTYLIDDNTGITVGTELVTVTGGLKNGEIRTGVDGTGGSITQGDCFAEFKDNRLNRFDVAALAVIYQNDDGYEVWQIDPATSKGGLAFSMNIEDILLKLIDAQTLGENQLVQSNEAGTVSFWALPNAQCQMNYISQDGNTREYRFNCLLPFADQADEILENLEAQLS